jgi:hypothetical protein
MRRRLALLLTFFGFILAGILSAEMATTETVNVIVDTRDYPCATTGDITVDTRESPTLATPAAYGVMANTADLGGNVSLDGGAAITERGVVYALASINANPMIGGSGVNKLTASGTTGIFAVPVTGLTPGTGHVFKAYATNLKGTSYTAATLFTTLTLTQGWRQTHFGSPANTGNAADGADPDGDGLKNLLEYALNLPPNAASRVPAAVQAAGGNLEYTYTRGTAAYNGGTTFQVEWSDDLTTWFTTGVVESLLSDDGTQQQVKATLPAGSGGRRFVRLRVQ